MWWFSIFIYCEMISTVGLINIHHYTLLHFFFLWWKHVRYTLWETFIYGIQYYGIVIMFALLPHNFFIPGSLCFVTPSLPPSLPPLVTTKLFSVSMSLFLFVWLFMCFLVCFLDSTFKWGHKVFVFYLSDLFHLYNVLKVHPCCHE